MAFAITQTCCSDATCVSVCPVNCIHPTPEERAFGSTEMLHIDPKSCIDCGACADACPVDAVFPVERLTGGQREYARINAAYYEGEDHRPEQPVRGPVFHDWGAPSFDRVLPPDFGPLRVAVVGTGPAGMYAARDLLLHTPAEVTLIDRLPVAGGLVRYGVAPDHPSTKKAGESFARFLTHPRVRLCLGLEVGASVTADELAAHHDAVIYAVGAPEARRLGVPGEDRPGSVAASEFVAWCNGHPDVAPDAFELSADRAVVVGNGNVALDAARLLVSDPATLQGTPIAEHALAGLRRGKVREVVVLGRRGPQHAAYTRPELLALKHLSGVDLLVDDHDPAVGAAIDGAADQDKAAVLKDVRREAVDWSLPPAADGRRRIVFRFLSAPAEVRGEESVRAVRVTGANGEAEIPAGTVLRAVGHRGTPLDGLPFDESTGTVPNDRGRVTGRPGAYVVGWIKRGASGGIGANRVCATETVGSLLDDAASGRLPAPTGSARSFRRLARRRGR
ncbi:FAD-dependent oxidoreductase [Actinospica acidiphila]|nr:FAD-dependent oxidoreductase [Actinospica acidiphila]